MERNKVCSIPVSLCLPEFVALTISMIFAFNVVQGTTDPDLQALQVVYASVNSPLQLTGWKSSGGDPCGELWKGITCQGSTVVAIHISWLGLNGTMGYLLNNLASLRTLDLSGNNIQDSIPYQLPPNLSSLNLANNNLSGNLPFSIAGMFSLSYLLSESVVIFGVWLPHLLWSGKMPTIWPNKRRLAAILRQTKRAFSRPTGRSVYRYP